jgi:hypothetical protein
MTRDSERKAWTELVLKREAEAKKKRPRRKKEPQSTPEQREAALDDLSEEGKP